MIEARNLVKYYGPIEALRDVSFEINRGEIVGLLGPNGAGKSTLIKILTGYLQPDRGQAKIDGLDVLTEPQRVQARIGYLPENAPSYAAMSVQSYLKMMAELRRLDESERQVLLSQAILATGLQEHLTRPIGQLSKGFRQRVGLAQAILHKPPLLILDEPTIGLDPTQIVEIRNLIRRLSQQSTVLFSTHILPEVEALCDRVIILMNGQVRADARLSELSQDSDVLLILQESVPGVVAALEALVGVSAARIEPATFDQGQAYRVVGHRQDGLGADLSRAVYELARGQGWPVRELRRDVRTLEAVFNELATTSAGEPEDAAAEAG